MISRFLNFASSKLAFIFARKIVANFFGVSTSEISTINVFDKIYFCHKENSVAESEVLIIDLGQFKENTLSRLLPEKDNGKSKLHYISVASSYLDSATLEHRQLMSFLEVLGGNNNSRIILYKPLLLKDFYVFIFNEN